MTSTRSPRAVTRSAKTGAFRSSSRIPVAAARSARVSNSGTTSSSKPWSSDASAASSWTASTSEAVAREAHDVTPAARRPEPALELGHRAERREDLPSGRARLAAARAEPVEGGGDDGGVLPDLELRQVEPERLRLPEEVLELPVGEPLRAGGGQRPLDDAEVVTEGVRVGVPAARLAPGRRQAVRGQSASIRRCGESASRRSQLAGDHREERPRPPRAAGRSSWVAGVSRSEAVRDLAMRRASDSRPSRTCSDAISTARRVTSAVTSRVAVPVAADPRPPSEERPIERRRSRPGTGRERAIHLAGHDGQHVEDRLVEQRHLGAHLVQRLRTAWADLARCATAPSPPPSGADRHPGARSRTAARRRAVAPARRRATGSRRSRAAAPRSDAR